VLGRELDWFDGVMPRPGIIRSNIFNEFLPHWLGCWVWPLASPLLWCLFKSPRRGPLTPLGSHPSHGLLGAQAAIRLATSDEFRGRGPLPSAAHVGVTGPKSRVASIPI